MSPDVDAVQARTDSGAADDAAPVKAPHFDESVRRVLGSGKATLGSAVDTGRALRKLVAADFVLARSATGRAAAWLAAAIVFGATSSLLLMGAIIALLRATIGLSWLASISLAAVISLVATGVAAWRTSVFFDLAGMHASRRQLARIGIGREKMSGLDDEPSTPEQVPPA